MNDGATEGAFRLELPAAQRAVLDALKTYVRDVLGVTDKRFDDWYLVRFCEAKAFNLEQTKEMFKKCLEWRQANEVDNFHAFDESPVRQVDHLIPHNYYCVDKEGQCVYIERYKNFDLKEIRKVARPY